MKRNSNLRLDFTDFAIIAFLATLILGAWTYTYDTATPLGSDAPSVIDDRIREVKAGDQERFNIDHYAALTGTELSDADVGKHRQITFRAPLSADPTAINADEAQLYTLDVSSKAELKWIDEDENVLQLTSGGTINITSADLVGTLASNTYFTCVDNAGTGTANLIKADANDDAVLPDGAELATSAAPTTDQAIANKLYVDNGGERSVGGTATVVYTKYLTGTTDADAGTDVAHGITGVTNILHVSAAIDNGSGRYFIHDLGDNVLAASAFVLTYDATNIKFSSVGSNLQGQAYVIKVDYK